MTEAARISSKNTWRKRAARMNPSFVPGLPDDVCPQWYARFHAFRRLVLKESVLSVFFSDPFSQTPHFPKIPKDFAPMSKSVAAQMMSSVAGASRRRRRIVEIVLDEVTQKTLPNGAGSVLNWKEDRAAICISYLSLAQQWLPLSYLIHTIDKQGGLEVNQTAKRQLNSPHSIAYILNLRG